MNTAQNDINKAAQKIIAGAERIQRFVEKYHDYLSDEDKAKLAQIIKNVDDKLNQSKFPQPAELEGIDLNFNKLNKEDYNAKSHC